MVGRISPQTPEPGTHQHSETVRTARYSLPTLLAPLCFHILTNCFSCKPFILITIRIARGCGVHTVLLPSSVTLWSRWQPLFFQGVAASLNTFISPRPLFSMVWSLFFKNTRVGGMPANSPFDINKMQTLFSAAHMLPALCVKFQLSCLEAGQP